MTPLQLKVLDDVREFIARSGLSPSVREIAAWNGLGVRTAHDTIATLVAAGQLARGAERVRNLRLVDQPDLRGVASDVLAAELARRGVTLASLDRRAPRAIAGEVTCAADTCGAIVERGHLMCRPHWFALPAELRERVLRTNARARADNTSSNRAVFERAVTEARDLIDSGAWRRRA